MSAKRSQHELSRLVESAVADTCRLPRLGLWFCVDVVEASGRIPHQFEVRATLHFLPAGSPFCCGEPGCHLGLCDEDRVAEVGEHIRRAMHLRQTVMVKFRRITVNYHPGVDFHHGRGEAWRVSVAEAAKKVSGVGPD